ncbi:methionine--tRNA ligase [Lewinellaceae bacterium SD302]|nr:methionine--tRNA ligase [Lewinellaceae bacterium SD302]
MAQRYLVTSALPYANGPLHLGHLAGAYLPADIFVRYQRLLGKDVVWVCGSDEHGAAITIRAKKEGISPRDIIDKYHNLNKDTFERLGISFDNYHRTSALSHHTTSQEFFLHLHEQGDQFEVRSQEQYYDDEFDQFLADRYIKGTCPKCGYDSAYGDQCENCGSDLSPTELIDPVSTLSGNKPELKETKHWYFKLEQHNEWLKHWIKTGEVDGKQLHDPKDWKKHVNGQCLSWLDDGLRPRAITRDLDWGIPVPVEGGEGKVLYVWFDAPIGYISSTKDWAERNDKDWKTYWKDPETELVHFIGKDNIVFHCIIFPAMLKAHGGYNLPKNVPANQFLNFEGQKFSKSRGWGIEQHEYLEAFKDFPNKEDALRWSLIRNLPEQKDADFSWDEFIDFHDKELADKLGNFVNRVIVLTHKYFGGQVPAVSGDLNRDWHALFQGIGENIQRYSFKQAALDFVELTSWGNTFLQDSAPWSIFKENPEDPRIAEILRTGLEVTAALSIAAAPFLPFTSTRLRELLQLPALKNGDWHDALNFLIAGDSLIGEGHTVGKATVLFPKINDRKDDSRLKIVQAQQNKLKAIMAKEASGGTEVLTNNSLPGPTKADAVAASAAKENTPPTGPADNERPDPKPEITFEDFSKLDLRTATITEAKAVKKADKLLELTVDLGNETRTVVSGIAQHYQPEEVVGQRVVMVTNLAPRKMRGVVSQGMILMAEDETGKLVFVSAPDGFANGWVVR